MRYLQLGLLAVVVSASAAAQLDTAPTSMTTVAVVHPRISMVAGPGFAIPVMLQTPVDSRAKIGAPVRFTVIDDVTDSGTPGGRVLIPRKARVLGRVVEAVRRDAEHPESRLSILVERAEWDGGRSAELSGYVAAIYKMPDYEVHQTASRSLNPNTVDATEAINRTNSIHPHLQSDVSPGQLDPCYERGCGVDVVKDKDVRLLALEDVSLRPDGTHGSVLVSSKRSVRLEKWTTLVLRTNGILLAQNN